MNQLFREQFDKIFGVQLVEVQPEKPIDPPYRGNTSLSLAMKRLRKSLDSLGMQSPYWDEMVRFMRDETSDDEADRVALAVQQRESTVVLDIMAGIEQRAIRKTAERFVDQLGVVS